MNKKRNIEYNKNEPKLAEGIEINNPNLTDKRGLFCICMPYLL